MSVRIPYDDDDDNDNNNNDYALSKKYALMTQ